MYVMFATKLWIIKWFHQVLKHELYYLSNCYNSVHQNVATHINFNNGQWCFLNV